MKRRLRCSFCGKPDTEVAKLVAGTGGRGTRARVFICDQCVARARDVLASSETVPSIDPDPTRL